jgi:hypothetical protein
MRVASSLACAAGSWASALASIRQAASPLAASASRRRQPW